jgi:hypothetical protein
MVKAAAALGNEAEIRKTAAAARKQIGRAKRQKEKGYAGINVRDLAESYKLLADYLTVYRHESNAVHGLNAISYITLRLTIRVVAEAKLVQTLSGSITYSSLRRSSRLGWFKCSMLALGLVLVRKLKSKWPTLSGRGRSSDLAMSTADVDAPRLKNRI